MRLLTDTNGKKTIDLNIDQLSYEQLAEKIREFQPEVIFALSDDENELVLEFSVAHSCHMGFFKPTKEQLNTEKLEQSRRDQLAKIIFLDKNHQDLAHFDQCGRVIHQNYLEECQKLLNFIFFYDGSAFD